MVPLQITADKSKYLLAWLPYLTIRRTLVYLSMAGDTKKLIVLVDLFESYEAFNDTWSLRGLKPLQVKVIHDKHYLLRLPLALDELADKAGQRRGNPTQSTRAIEPDPQVVARRIEYLQILFWFVKERKDFVTKTFDPAAADSSGLTPMIKGRCLQFAWEYLSKWMLGANWHPQDIEACREALHLDYTTLQTAAMEAGDFVLSTHWERLNGMGRGSVLVCYNSGYGCK